MSVHDIRTVSGLTRNAGLHLPVAVPMPILQKGKVK